MCPNHYILRGSADSSLLCIKTLKHVLYELKQVVLDVLYTQDLHWSLCYYITSCYISYEVSEYTARLHTPLLEES